MTARDSWPEPGTQGWRHLDSMSDEGAAYTLFHGWRLTCLWCEYAAEADTRTAGLALMQAHYDRVCGRGNAVLLTGPVDA